MYYRERKKSYGARTRWRISEQSHEDKRTKLKSQNDSAQSVAFDSFGIVTLSYPLAIRHELLTICVPFV